MLKMTIGDLRRVFTPKFQVMSVNSEDLNKPDVIAVTESLSHGHDDFKSLIDAVLYSVRSPSETMRKSAIRLRRKWFFGLFTRSAKPQEIFNDIYYLPRPEVSVTYLNDADEIMINAPQLVKVGEDMWLCVSQWNGLDAGVYRCSVTKNSLMKTSTLNHYRVYYEFNILNSEGEVIDSSTAFSNDDGFLNIARTYFSLHYCEQEARDRIQADIKELQDDLQKIIDKNGSPE